MIALALALAQSGGAPAPIFTADESRYYAVEHLAPPEGVELVVADRPLIVYGMLPPIAEGLAARPRALLIGRTDGTTLEYRTDDVRLLGIRQGRFVERTDWIGRGGTALQPLGQVVYLHQGGDPGPAFELSPRSGVGRGKDSIALGADLCGTWVRGSDAGITYRLSTPDGRRIATVEESMRLVPCSVGTGFVRRFRIEAEGTSGTLVARTVHIPRAGFEKVESFILSGPPRGPTWSVSCGQIYLDVEKEREGLFRVTVLPRPPHLGRGEHRRGDLVTVEIDPSEPRLFEEAWLFTTRWDERTSQTFSDEVLL